MFEQYRQRRVPYGFPFLNVEQTSLLQEKSRAAQELLRRSQYERIMPASLDFPETFSKASSSEAFQVRDHLGEDLSLRNDVTVQVIKGFTNQLDFDREAEHRFYYTVPVFRDVRRSYPALREVQQIGAELLGKESHGALSELLQVAAPIFSEVLETPLYIFVGNVAAVHALEGYTVEPLQEPVIRRDAPALAGVLEASGFQQRQAQELARLTLFRPNRDTWKRRSEALLAELSGGEAALLRTLQEVWHGLENFADELQPKLPSLVTVSAEPLLLRPTDYYSGLLFEGYVPNLSFPPLRGGSYDGLIREYSNEDLAASGFALDLSSLVLQGTRL